MPTSLITPESPVDLDGLRTWLLTNSVTQPLAESILQLITYTFDLTIKIVLVYGSYMPYAEDPTDNPGKQGRVDLLISGATDPNYLYQHIVLDTGFDVNNIREWVVDINPLTSQ